MKRRLLAALAAVLSAALGGALLLGYVAGADRRAMAGMDPVQVLVAKTDVPTGTSGSALTELVTVKTLPATALAPGAVQDVSTLAGLVSTTELKSGEQVLASRFADPATLADAGRPEVPRGKQQIAIDLEPQRVLGGELEPGAQVAVFTTIKDSTRLAVRSALVVRVDAPAAGSGDAKDAEKSDASSPTAPADGRVRVTLAMTATEATRLVAGANSGAVWFSLVRGPSTPTTSPAATAPKGATS